MDLGSRSLCYIWTYLDYRNLCYTLQKPVLHLDVSTPQGPELYLDETGQYESILGSELHPDLSALQSPVQHMNVSAPQGPKLQLNLSGQ
jgi:hypothetical protein